MQLVPQTGNDRVIKSFSSTQCLLRTLTKHGGIVDAKRTRNGVTTRYMSAKPNDEERYFSLNEIAAH